MKKKQLAENTRNMTHMGIQLNKPKTRIYLRGVSKKTGAEQWYESIRVFTKSTATSYFSAGNYKVVFAGGMRKSKTQNWV
jgi:hypothetical protein